MVIGCGSTNCGQPAQRNFYRTYADAWLSDALRMTTDEKDFVSEMVGTIRDAEKEIEKDIRHPDAT